MQQIYEDLTKHLKSLIKGISPRNIFLVTGKKSFSSSGAQKKVFEAFSPEINVSQFRDFRENPLLDDVLTGIAMFNKSDADLIIAIGGGSVIDMAKLINVFSNCKKDVQKVIRGEEEQFKSIPLVAIPTTAGTGSEATHFAVAYIDKMKYSVAGYALLPKYVILDSYLTYKVSSYLAACTGMDTLSQAVESHWNVNSTKESILFSKKAIEICVNHLVNAVNGNLSSRDNMMQAAFYAGKAINITKTTAYMHFPILLLHILIYHTGTRLDLVYLIFWSIIII